MSTRAQKIARLANKEYRDAFVGSQINVGIPFQIRALREQRAWKQADLASKADMLQPRISAMERPGAAKFNLETLRRLAAAFDVALEVRFVPFSDLVDWSERFDPDAFSIPSFADDPGLIEHKGAQSVALGTAFPEEFRRTGTNGNTIGAVGQVVAGGGPVLPRTPQSGYMAMASGPATGATEIADVSQVAPDLSHSTGALGFLGNPRLGAGRLATHDIRAGTTTPVSIGSARGYRVSRSVSPRMSRRFKFGRRLLQQNG